MDADELLCNIVKWRSRPKGATNSLAAAVDKFVARELRPRKKLTSVVDVWNEVLPGELTKRCRLVSLSRGTLKIEVEAGSYMFQMQALSSQLVKEFQQSCPAAGIHKIKFVACGR